MGQGIGIAIAVASRAGANTHTVDIPAVQALLRSKGAAID
jgi:hypothetical protein